MKEKVMRVAQGKLVYYLPKLVLSNEKLILDVVEGGMTKTTLTIENEELTPMKGIGTTDSFYVDFLPIFYGKRSELEVKVYAREKEAGDIIEGNLTLITECGEKFIPYEIHVVPRFLEGPWGKITSYEEFVQLARDHKELAVEAFYHPDFLNICLKDLNDKRIYQKLVKRNPKKAAVDEFLIAHGDRKILPFQAKVNRSEWPLYERTLRGILEITTEQAGEFQIRITPPDGVELEKTEVTNEDFHLGKVNVIFKVQAEEIPEGKHAVAFGLENEFQKIEVPMLFHRKVKAEERAKRRERKKVFAELVPHHIQYLLNSSRKNSWIAYLKSHKNILAEELGEWDWMLESYLSFLDGEKEPGIFLQSKWTEMTKPVLGANLQDVMGYCLIHYVRVNWVGTEDEKKELVQTILQYYQNGYRHWCLLILLERLGRFHKDDNGLAREVQILWRDGCNSPYLMLYQAKLLMEEPERLNELDTFQIHALHFALKYGVFTEPMEIKTTFLASRSRHFTPGLFSILVRCYNDFHKDDMLQCICTVLITAGRTENTYYKWFKLGVQRRLHISELFEYYMYTMEDEEYDRVLPVVLPFFQYENHLKDDAKLRLYESIIRNKHTQPGFFRLYSDQIINYMLTKVKSHEINEKLGVLYREFLTEDLIRNAKDHPALSDLEIRREDIAALLFTGKIHVKNPNIVRVAVTHCEGGGEQSYNLKDGEAVIRTATEHPQIYFVDRAGVYHTKSVSYEMTPLFAGKDLADYCYQEGVKDPLLMLHIFSRTIQKRTITTVDAVLLHQMVEDKILGIEYRNKALLALYEYYRNSEEEASLTQTIEKIDFAYIPKDRYPGILQTMIQHNMTDMALKFLMKYQLVDITSKLLVMLVSRKIEEEPEKMDIFCLKLCNYLYRKGAMNKVTLKYLSEFYIGESKQLYKIYRTAVKKGVDLTDDAIERILGQVIFVGEDGGKYTDAFIDYYEYGANKTVVKAYLYQAVYQFITDQYPLAEELYDIVRRESLSDDHQLMILGMLKLYSTMDSYDDKQREFIEYHLARFAAEEKIFLFMKEFIGKVQVPFEIQYTDLIQYYAHQDSDVFVELTGKDQPGLTLPMRRIFSHIFVFDTLIFYGETLRYKIYEGKGGNPVQEGILEKRTHRGRMDDSLYRMVEEMIIARDSAEEEEYRKLANRYRRVIKAAHDIFKPV